MDHTVYLDFIVNNKCENVFILLQNNRQLFNTFCKNIPYKNFERFRKLDYDQIMEYINSSNISDHKKLLDIKYLEFLYVHIYRNPNIHMLYLANLLHNNLKIPKDNDTMDRSNILYKYFWRYKLIRMVIFNNVLVKTHFGIIGLNYLDAYSSDKQINDSDEINAYKIYEALSYMRVKSDGTHDELSKLLYRSIKYFELAMIQVLYCESELDNLYRLLYVKINLINSADSVNPIDRKDKVFVLKLAIEYDDIIGYCMIHRSERMDYDIKSIIKNNSINILSYLIKYGFVKLNNDLLINMLKNNVGLLCALSNDKIFKVAYDDNLANIINRKNGYEMLTKILHYIGDNIDKEKIKDLLAACKRFKLFQLYEKIRHLYG